MMHLLQMRRLLLILIGTGLLMALSHIVYAHGMSEAEKQAVIAGGNLRYLWLGATHMLSGYDHLAFVFGIIFFLTTFRDIAKYVTAFTLGHSVTLIYATFNAVQLNYFLIDAVIALSVCYIAFANLDGFRKHLGVNPPNMMAMIVGLGLIHGFGLSTRLQELPLSTDDLLLNIISFNVGVELGQITALALMLVVIAAWRKTRGFAAFSLIANYVLILMGAFLFLMQMHGYEHTTNAEELSPVTRNAEGASAVVQALPEKEGAQSTQAPWKDTITIEIPARGDKEYKLYLTKGATLEYAWQTDGAALFFDFHGEPAGDSTGFFQSFAKDTQNRSSGSLTTNFEGTHGWYWKNSSTSPVAVTLHVRGDYRRLDTGDSAVQTHDSID